MNLLCFTHYPISDATKPTGIQFYLPKVLHSITQNPYSPNPMHYLQSGCQWALLHSSIKRTGSY
ncbi:MAG: hypothetical protein ABOJ95_000821 [Wolbachia endosymbiont of Armadillidium vulgare]|uniref:hypothetical protein n=1 Tax=Wolbachia endosymbiont of Armadillidium vulgare TaxID=77039 RepID=UPI000649FCC6|nr:hypothetical protein [Wolbachia endosymbiont of Armadillidium vulgare]